MRTLYLVSCVARKSPEPQPAAGLYLSSWFVKARAWVLERLRPGDEWFILSAAHGLLHPGAVTAPYDTTLNTMRRPARLAWGACVVNQLLPWLDAQTRIVVLAGARYREFLVPSLRNSGYTVEIPMETLPIGKQMAWLLSQTTNGTASDEPAR